MRGSDNLPVRTPPVDGLSQQIALQSGAIWRSVTIRYNLVTISLSYGYYLRLVLNPFPALVILKMSTGGAARENVVGDAGEGPERTVCLSV